MVKQRERKMSYKRNDVGPYYMMWGKDERRYEGRTLEGNQPVRGTDQILRPNLTGADLEARVGQYDTGMNCTANGFVATAPSTPLLVCMV
jgi:hypothetical protein